MLYLDVETYNEADIRVGTYRYAETAEVLLFAYAFEDEPARVWDCTKEPLPHELRELLADDNVLLTAHNAMFDRTILSKALGLATSLSRWRCTMVKAYSHALPGGLDQIGRVLNLPADKSKIATGKKLIHRFCKPASKNHKADRYSALTHPDEWEQFKRYAAVDVEAMREVDRRLPSWNWKAKDIEMYHLDQQINDRGFRVDRELTEAGARASVLEKNRMAEEFVELTEGRVTRPTQREQFRQYLNARFGLDLDNTRAETFRDMLTSNTDLPHDCKRLMGLSILSNKTSTTKYATLAPAVSADGNFRGGLQFRGAARTRRFAGRTFQPQNLPSRGLPDQRSIDLYIKALKLGMQDVLFDDQMLHAAAALRGVVIAGEGNRLAVADLSNIEGRVLAYLADEKWKIDAFFAFDRSEGPDLYNITASSILGQDPYKIDKKDRNVFGKVPDLAGGYQGGFGAFETFCKAYGVAMAEHEGTIKSSMDPEILAAAKANYTNWGRGKHPEADPKEWLMREAVKLGWRRRHPATVQLWESCEEAAKMAIQQPGKTYRAGKWLRFSVRKHAGFPYLLCLLPSGNFLCYFDPRHDEETATITYMGVDSTATGGMYGKWRRMSTYGGKLVENCCQSLALDIMVENMPDIDAGGYPIVLTVHDEIIAETAGTGEELAQMMERVPEWLPGFPLAAAGYTTARYRKD